MAVLVPTDPDTATATSDELPALAPLSAADIEAATDSGSYTRGRRYERGGHIFDTIRRGQTLRAQCHGSSGGPYRVEATLALADQEGDYRLSFVACDCPRGGFCKHIVALLLTWVHTPERFEPRPPIADLLAGKSQEELIAVIELLLRHEPGLESLLALPLSVTGPVDAAPVDTSALRRQIDAAVGANAAYDRHGYDFEYGYDGYGGAYGGSDAAALVHPLLDLAAAHEAAGHTGNAVRVLATLGTALAEQYESYDDQDGELGAIIVACDQSLARLLGVQATVSDADRLMPSDRVELIEGLYAIWEADVALGGPDLATEGPAAIGRHATPEEQQELSQRVRTLIERPAADPHTRQWFARCAIAFLSELSGDAGLSDEALLEEYRKAELWEDAAAALVMLGRAEEAIALAGRRLSAHPILLRFADLLVATGEPTRIDQAIELIDARLWEEEGKNLHVDAAYKAWLERQYAATARPAKALELARSRFKAAPSRLTFDAVKAAALLPGQEGDPWPPLRDELVAALGKRGDWAAVTSIHLEAGEVRDAIAAREQMAKTRVSNLSGGGWSWFPENVDTAVAEAAAAEFPEQAIAIFQDLADRLIAQRQRTSYRQAAAYLDRAKAIASSSGRAEAWQTLITELRQRYTSLRALREELDALGLN